jgi:TonB family protein
MTRPPLLPLMAAGFLLGCAIARPAAAAPEVRRQSFTVACTRETVFFTITTRDPSPGKGSTGSAARPGLEVSALAVHGRAASVPFLGMRRGEAAGTIVFTWGDTAAADTAAAGRPIAITIPWADEEKQTFVTDGDRIHCGRDTPEEVFPPFDEPPVALMLFPPEYPEGAKQAKIEGVVHVRMTIAETGRVITAEVHRSDAIALLDAAAVEAAKLSIFRPAMKAGHPVKARVVLPFRFKL